jgi:hypothetical protein
MDCQNVPDVLDHKAWLLQSMFNMDFQNVPDFLDYRWAGQHLMKKSKPSYVWMMGGLFEWEQIQRTINTSLTPNRSVLDRQMTDVHRSGITLGFEDVKREDLSILLTTKCIEDQPPESIAFKAWLPSI